MAIHRGPRRIVVLATIGALLLGSAPAAARVADHRIPPHMVPAVKSRAVGTSAAMFIENVGQFAAGARFRMLGGGCSLWLAEGSLWITLPEKTARTAGQAGGLPDWPGRMSRGAEPRHAVHLRLSFVGADPHPSLEPFDRLETHVSCFIGADAAKWRPDVPVWGGVRYLDLYPGLDLEVSSEAGRPALRLVVRDGALARSSLERVRLRVEGAESLALEQGQLQLGTASGAFALPLLQLEGASAPPQPQLAGKEVVAPFAPSGALPAAAVSDPSDLLYATFLGGGSSDQAWAMAVDGAGQAYVAGRTLSSDFPAAQGPGYDTSYGAGYDAFVAKLNAVGTGLVYATFLGGSNDDNAYGIGLDGAGQAYVTGGTLSTDFPAANGPGYQTVLDFTYGRGDVFVVKLSASGTAIVYATYLGGDGEDVAYGIAADSSGYAYVTGETQSADFPAALGPGYDTTFDSHNVNAFVVKVAPNGMSLVYATFLCGALFNTGFSVALDGAGQAYVAGATSSADFAAMYGPGYDTTHNGNYDVFVVKLNAAGTSLKYATFIGGSGNDYGLGIAVDAVGEAYVTGYTLSADFPAASGPGYDTTYNGDLDAFVVKLNAVGMGIVYATYLGGSGLDEARAIAVDGAGLAYVTGVTASAGFPAAQGPGYSTTFSGVDDAYLAKLNATGTDLLYASFLGGNGSEWGLGVCVAGSGVAYVAGSTSSADFPGAGGPGCDSTYNGGADTFVLELTTDFHCDEPGNNSYTGACGPLVPGYTREDYISSAEDTADWFYFDSASPYYVEAWLTNMCAGCDFNLTLYDDTLTMVPGGYSGNWGSAPEHLLAFAPAGHYYLRVDQSAGSSVVKPYELRVMYAAMPVVIKTQALLPLVWRGE